MKKFYVLLLTLAASYFSNAQVTITPPPALTVSACSFPTPYYSLGDIKISEQSLSDFSSGGDFVLSAPANFEFEPGVGAVNTTGGDLSISNLIVDANTISFTITVNSSSNTDEILISGIQARGINTASGPDNIYRSGGTSVVTGDEVTDAVSHGSLTSVLYPSPAPATSPVDGSVCDAGTVTISATSVAGTTIDWYDAATGGALVGSGASFTTPSISATTIYYAEVRNTTTGCVSATRTAVTASVSLLPAVATTPVSGSVCGTGTVTISATSTGGTTIDWYDAATGGALVGSGASFTTPSISATTIYYAEVRNTTTGCVSATRTAVTATVSPLPAVATSPVDGSICGTGTVTISATSPGGTTIDWYDAATGGTLVGTGSSFTTPSISATTIYYAEVRNTTTGCVSAARTAATAAVSAIPAAPSGATSGSVCGTGIVSISVAAPATGLTIDWYAGTSGGTVLTGGAATTTFTTPSISASTTYYAEVRNTTTGCVSATRTPVAANVNPVPAAPSGAVNGSKCGAGTVALSVAAPGAGLTVDWYAAASGGAVIAGGTSTTNFTTPAISITTNYYAEVRNTTTGCVSATRTLVAANVNLVPAVPSGAVNGSRCGTGTVAISVAAPGAGLTVDWYAAASGGAVLAGGASTTNFTTPSISITTNYYAEVRNTTTACVSATRTLVAANVNPVPAAPTGAVNGARCGTGTVGISVAAPAAGLTIDWYATASGGAVLTGGTGTTSFTSPSISATTIYYAEVRNTTTGCLSATRTAVTAAVSAVPSAPTGAVNSSRCGTGIVTISVAAPGTGLTIDWYAATSGGAVLTGGSGTTGFTTPSISANTIYYAEVRNTTTGCVSATRTAVTATVNPIPATATGAVNGARCGTGTVAISVTAPGAGLTIDWYAGASGGTVLTGGTGTISFTTPSIGGTTIYYAEVRSTSTGCVSATRIPVTATINAVPSISGTLSVCQGSTTQLTGAGTPAASSPWVSANTAVATINSTGLVAGVSSGTSVITYTNNNGCTITATVSVNPIPPTTGATICQGDAGTLTSSAACAAGSTVTAGPILAGTAVTGGGTADAWVNATRVSANDNMYATVSINNVSEALNATQFGFAIPANATITGIQVTIERFASSTNSLQDNSVRLIKAGAAIGNNNGATTAYWGTSALAVNYGSASDLWGTTWSPSQINAANFGVGLIVDNNNNSNRTASVDYIQISVTYTIPGTLNWYTVSSGGTSLGVGSPFNPVGVAGSGLANTSTPGTTTFYAECAAFPGCRTPTNFVINSLPTVTGTLNICIGGTTQLTGSAAPAASTPWVSGTPGVATVSNTGLVTGISAGTSVITYTNSNGCKITATVTVLQPAITGTLSVCIGATTQLTGSGTPAAASPWVSSTPGVATVSASGLVTGVTAGSGIITYKNSIGCTATSTVTVNPDATIALTSAPATNNQTVCINNAITSIKYTIGGSGTGATVAGLPAGLTTSFSGGIFTISGSPTASGTFNYTITSTGPCVKPSLTGTIDVQANSTITRTSSSSTIAQSVCINNAIANIVYTIGGDATGVTVTGLPGGVSGVLSGNTYTISGSPNVSGSFSFTVTTTGPCVNPSLNGTITVNALPTAVTVASTGSFDVGLGTWNNCDHATITASNGGSGTIYFQNTTSGGTSTATASSSQIVYTSGTYYFRARSASGCWGAQGSVNVTILPLPAAVTVNGGGIFCGSTTITASNGNSGTMYFQGTNSTGTSVTTPSNSQVITTSGTYYFRAKSVDGCWGAVGSAIVTINPLPAGTLTPSATSICSGSTVTFTASTGFGSYIFKINSVTRQTGTSNIFNTNALAGGDIVTVDVANSFNCGATFTSVPVTINPLPTASLGADKTLICPGDLVTFTASGGTNYIFKVNNAAVQSSASPTYTNNLLNNGDSVTVDVKNAGNCTATSAAVYITVKPVPTGSLSASATSICEGDPVTFTATANVNYTYEFKVNGTTAQGPSASNIYTTDTLANTQVVTVIAKNSSGCSASLLPGILITVNPSPAGTLVATENSGIQDDYKICAGAPVTFTFSTPGYSSYNFKINGISKKTGPSNFYIDSTLANGDVVTVDILTGTNCGANFTVPAVIVVAPLNGTLSALPASVCKGDNVVFTATPGFDNYNFKLNGGSIQNGSSNTFTGNSLSNGDVIMVDVTNNNGNGCVNTFNAITLSVQPLPTGILLPVENSGIAPDDGIICAGANIVFTAPTGFTNYDFLLNGITVYSGPLNTYSNNTLVTGDSVQVAVKNSTGCIGLLNTINITSNPLPAVAPINGILSVCVNSTTALTNATAGGIWNSLNPGIATVDAAGIVTGVSAGNATITYTVSNTDGCNTVVNAQVIVNAIPTIAPITGNLSVCVNSATQLSEVTPGGTWSSDNTGVATVDGTGLVNGILAGTANISYSITNGSGCTTIVTAAVTVKALPVVAAITTTAPSFDVCVNSTITLSDVTGGGAWSSGTTSVATVNNSGVVTGVSGGTSIISYTVSANGCATIVTQLVTVNALPIPTLSGPNPICPNATDVYTTEAGQSNYNWTFTGGTLVSGGGINDNTITIKWDQPGARTIFVNYQNAFGCTGVTSATVTTSTGTVPTLAGPAVLCLNTSGTYTTQGGQADYMWNVSGGTITSGGTATDNTATINWTNPGAGSVSINFTDGGGCLAAVQTVQNVTVNPAPSVVTHDQSACAPATVNLTAAAVTTGSTPGLTYTYWMDAAATVSYSTPATAGAGTYYIKGTTAAGCYDIQPMTVSINAAPTVIITNPVAICAPSSVDLTAASITAGSTAGLSFTYWTNAAATTSYSTPATAGAGTYYIKGSTVSGCYSIQPVPVTINPLPVVITHSPAAICSPGTADLTLPAITSGSSTGLTFTYWTDAAATSAYATPATAGASTYYIKGTAASGCYDIKAITVSVSPTPTLVINNPSPVCTGSTVNLTLAAITSGSTAGLTFTYFTDAAATVSYATPTTAGTGTYYIKGATAGGCSDIKPVTVTVNPAPSVIVTTPAAICTPSSVNLTATSITAGSTAGLTFTYWTNAAATASYPTPTTAGAGTYYIKGTTAAGCYDIKSITITVNPSPVVVVTNPAGVCSPATVNLTAAAVTSGSTAGLTYTYWTDAAATASYATPTTAGAGTYYIKGTTAAGCFDIKPVTVSVNTLPGTPNITPLAATICQGSIVPLSSGTAPSTNTVTFSSGTINLAIPDIDNSTIGAASTIAVSGIPAGAVINSMSVNFNITHPYDDDLKINLKAPNNNVLNLVNSIGLSGDNFTNTTISSAATNSIIGGSAPFTGTFKASGTNNIPGASNVPGNTSNVATFAQLFSTPNGNWIFSARDVGTPDAGTINNWSITINYSVAATPQAVVWSPITDLYTDPGATTPYAGQSLATVYAKPATSGTKVYTATNTNATACTSSATTTLTVNAAPVVTIFADYCAVAGKVRLTASSTPAGVTYIWNTGQTGAFIDVDIADDYTVVASLGTGCSTTATISVATELVVNGDFSSGNTGFTSPPLGANQYHYVADGAGTNELLPEGLYGVGPDAHTYHGNFWGHDHTTGSGNFMIINGFPNGNPQPIVWQQTVPVLPNTTYYFSAWGMSINNAGPFAQLQFNVNGAQVGTNPVLPAGVNTNSNNGWTRFYGTMTTGPTTTTAVISITDLQNAPGGNDFGLDDISFGTLSTFVELKSPLGTDAQTPCINTAITPIVYSVGSTASGPTITGLPPGVTTSFDGELFTISGTPTASGNYTYTITTTGTCLPSTATGTINIQGQKITLTSGSAAAVCMNTSIPNIVYTLSGTATGATTSGLPAGVTGTLTGANTFTLSGTPTVTGIFNYIVATTGTCKPDTAKGTITVQAQTITLNSANNTQTICINKPIANIQYTVGGSATSASVSGLPPGVTGIFNSGFFIISGSPTVAAGSPYNYTVTTIGACGPVSAGGTITVTPAAAITLTTAGANSQVICNNDPITSIIYNINNATSASISSGTLPPGVTATFNAGVFTISGTATAGGIYNYTITTSGGCSFATASGSITVQSQSVTLTTGTGSPSLCANTAMAAIVYTIGGTASGATVTGLPAGVTGSLTGNLFTISGTPAAAAGPYPYTITTLGGCGSGTASGTITLSPAPVGGSLPTVLICGGSSGSITLSGNSTGSSVHHWEFSTDGGSTWTNAPFNTTITQSYSNVTTPTMYRAAVTSSGCSIVYSSTANLNIHNLWTGGTSINWNTASNWSGNALPSMSCPDVYIPGGTTYEPTLGAGIATINNLHIAAGGALTINAATLQIAGAIFNTGTFMAANGSIELNGSAPQTIPANTFQGNALNHLIVSNTSVTGVTIGGALDIYGSLTYTAGGTNLNTNGALTLKSNATNTAWIGDMTGHTINGDVTVERYISTGTNHAKSWQLLAIPTTGQTIKQSWEEGATASNVTNTPAGNPNPGFGTMITSDVTGAGTQPFPGFDLYTSTGPSMKVYNGATDTYIGPASTAMPIYNQKGYMVFVRGNRSISTSSAPANATVLRTKGTLFTTDPAHLPPTTTVAAGKFESVGNPYASAIDLRKLSLPSGINSTIIVWDATIGGANGYGIFQTLYLNGGNYVNLLPSPAYGAPGTINNNIQSGQAFFIQGLPSLGGTLGFTESVKTSGSNSLLLRPQSPSGDRQAQLRTNLYGVKAGGNATFADAMLIQYSDDYSNATDGLDARKMKNSSENLGIKREDKLLSIERRHTITEQDTIFLNLSTVRVQAYQFEFVASNLNTGVEGFLEDTYLQTKTHLDLSGSTTVNFTIENIPGSYASDRFRIVFSPAKVLPVTFTSLKAYRQDKNIKVEWKVENEMDIKQYEVEKSTNGYQFNRLAVKAATANGGHSATYEIADLTPVEGYNYYRVKSVDVNGKTAYTNVVKVQMGSARQDITIYPNPITDGMIHLQLMNQAAGTYGIRLLNKLGQVILTRQITHAEGSGTELIKWDYNLAHGIYQLEVTRPDHSIKEINVLY